MLIEDLKQLHNLFYDFLQNQVFKNLFNRSLDDFYLKFKNPKIPIFSYRKRDKLKAHSIKLYNKQYKFYE
jgi:hypothetical protein